ncbi:MAG TPA: hypothetical protein VGI06_04155 [Acidimicrobiales bacterium]|jgi:hypothetical protein
MAHSSACFAAAVGVPAAPIWEALTCPHARYMRNLSLRSCWTVGSRVELGPPQSCLTGVVLLVEPCRRLSFSLEDPSGSTVYVTWELRGCGQPTRPGPSTVVRLWVDESEGSDRDELEDIWLPVLGALTDAVGGHQPAPDGA